MTFQQVKFLIEYKENLLEHSDFDEKHYISHVLSQKEAKSALAPENPGYW